MGLIEHYSMGRRNFACENHWEELDTEKFRIVKPTVICLGGNATTTPQDANAVCKIAQSLVGLKKPSTQNEFASSNDVDFIGINYGTNKKSEEGRKYGSLTKEERREFVTNTFAPLFLDEDGSPLNKEQLLKNFNQVTFFSHCHGAGEITILTSEIYKDMLKHGIRSEVARESIEQMFSVTYAPWSSGMCPTLQVIPMKDNVLPYGPMHNADISRKLLMQHIKMGRANNYGTVVFKENDETISVLVSSITSNFSSEHRVSLTKRDENWQMVEKSATVYGDMASQVMGNALARSLANSIQNFGSDTFTPKPSLDTVLEEAQSILEGTENSEFENIMQKIKEDLGLPINDEQQAEELQPNVSDDLLVRNNTKHETTTISITPENLQETPFLPIEDNCFEQ